MDASSAPLDWPVGWDWLLLAIAVGGVLALTALGYVGMVLDYRAYLRSLRRALAPILRRLPGIPEWVLKETPRCLAVFGLRYPCSLEELKAAYRTLVKDLHPDRGGDQRRFLQLQQSFEEASRLLAAEET